MNLSSHQEECSSGRVSLSLSPPQGLTKMFVLFACPRGMQGSISGLVLQYVNPVTPG